MPMTLDDINNLQPEDIKKIGSAPLPVRLAVIVLLAIVVAVGGYFLLIKDKVESWEKAEAEEIGLKQQFEAKQKKASNLEAYEAQMEEMKKTFGSMLKSLPDQAEVENLLVEISRAGSANNLKINKFSPAGERPKEFYAEYPINMELFGTYEELTGFVSDIASLQRIVTLHDFNIKPTKDGSKINVKLNARTYRYLSDENQ